MRLNVLVALTSLFLLSTGCRSFSGTTQATLEHRGTPLPPVKEEAPLPHPEALIREASQAWMGVPYRLGGISRQGIDCSAFVQSLYRDALGLDLPRTTTDQVEVGSPVSAQELRSGDLVFFRPYNRNRHVGIYLSRGEFIHASTSNGVMISRLDEPYWQENYWTARRILGTPPPPEAGPEATPAPVGRRVTGW